MKPYKVADFEAGTDSYNLGGLFTFVCYGWDYLVKFIIEPDKRLIIKVVCDNDEGRKSSDLEEYFLNTLMFLLGKD